MMARQGLRGSPVWESRYCSADHVHADDLVAGFFTSGEEQDREGSLYTTVRARRLGDQGRHSGLRLDPLVADLGTKIGILTQDIDGFFELFSGWKRLVA